MRLLMLFCLYEHLACLQEDSRHSMEAVGISANGEVNLMRAQVREPSEPLCNKLWDGKTVYGQDGGMQCVVTPLAPHWSWGGGDPPNMCLRPYEDFMSDIVRQLKRWPDCAALAYLWTKLPDSHVVKHSAPFTPCRRSGVKRLFVDIGANIGSCTMQMLSRPDVAEVVAFEPDRKNLFYLTGGVLKNQGYGNKLKLFPMALGSVAGPHQMFVTPGGKTVMHAATVANPVLPSQSVKTETSTLDEVFLAKSHHAPYIHVMKIHSRGLEVKILEGGRQLLASGAVNAIHFELAPMWLLSEGSTPAELFTILATNGYNCYHSIEDIPEAANLPAPLSHDELEHIACLENEVPPRGFFAIYSAVKAKKSNQPEKWAISCPDEHPTEGFDIKYGTAP